MHVKKEGGAGLPPGQARGGGSLPAACPAARSGGRAGPPPRRYREGQRFPSPTAQLDLSCGAEAARLACLPRPREGSTAAATLPRVVPASHPGRGCGDPTWKHLACLGSLCCNNGTELVILSETPLTCVPPGGVCPVPPHVLLSFGEGVFAPCWVEVVEAFVLVWNCWWLKFSVETVLLQL